MAESNEWEIQPAARQSAFAGWDTRDFLKFFISNLLIILMAVGAGAGAGYWFYTVTPRAYEATGSFLVDELPFLQSSKGTDAETERKLAETMIISLVSRPMLAAMAKRMGIDEGRLQFEALGLPLKLKGPLPVANLTITPTRNTRLGNIAAISQNPEFAAQAVNALIDEIQTYNRAGGKLNNLKTSVELNRARAKDLLGQLDTISAQRLKAEKEKNALDDHTDSKLPLEAFPAFAEDTTLNNLKTQLILTQSEYDSVASTSVRGPRLDGKRAELAGLKSQVEQQAQRLAGALRSQYTILVTQETRIREEIKTLRDQVHAMTQTSAEIFQNTGDPAALQKLLDDSKGESGDLANIFAIVYRATPPTRPERPKLWVDLALGILFGGAIGLGVSTLRAVLDIRLRSAQQIERQTGKPCLALLPRFPTRPASLVGFDQSQSPLGFSYLCTHLLRVRDAVKEHRIIGFAPTRPDKDCSSLTARLGVLLAHADKRTLVVDLHLQSPRIASYYPGVTVEKGLGEWFVSDEPLASFISSSTIRELGVLAVKDTRRPGLNDLLTRRNFSEALIGLLDDWDFILIDAPNILTDWKLMLTLPANGRLIICTKYGGTTSEDAIQALARTQGPSWKVEGFAMTHCPKRLT